MLEKEMNNLQIADYRFTFPFTSGFKQAFGNREGINDHDNCFL